MKRSTLLLAACSLGLLASQNAWGATRTWISGVGDDVNPCSRTAPCKTFAGAIGKTDAGGEIDTLDPGGFGAVTVTKAMTLANEGVGEAGILVAGTNGIVVNCAGDPTCVVVIRGLVIDGGPNGSNSLAGVKFFAGKTLIIENTTIRNFSGPSPNGYGVWFAPTVASPQAFNLTIENSTISTNGQLSANTGGGVFVAPVGPATANVVLDHVRVIGNNAGVRVDNTNGSNSGIDVVVSNSVVSENVNGGVAAITTGATLPATIEIDHSTVSHNNVGLNANGAGATIRFGSTTVHANATAFKNTSGVLTTYGNNQVNGNAALGATPGSGPPS
jgi:hypothetical protein